MPSGIVGLLESWSAWMGSMLWQASLLIVVVGLIDRAISRFAWPPVRHALWMLVLVKLVLPPTLAMPTGVVGHLRPWLGDEVADRLVGPPVVAQAAAPAGTGVVAPVGDAVVPILPPADPATGGGEPQWVLLAATVWIAGMLVVSLLLWARIATLRRWHRQQEERGTVPEWYHELLVATAERLGLERLPAIVFHDKAVAPAVYGLFRPTLLLPQRYLEKLGRDEAEHVLTHELAHIKRGDLWLNAAWLVVQAVYWFNPLVAWARREVKHVREMCCDLTVANLLRERTAGYRSTLLNTARELLTESVEPGMGLLGVFEEPFRLVPRLRLLEKGKWPRRGVANAAAVAVAAVVAAALLPMAAALQAPQAGVEPGAQAPGERNPKLEDAGPGWAVYAREVTRVDDCLLGYAVRSQDAAVSELWVGEGVISVTERGHSVIVDRGQGRFTFVDHHTGTYVESPLPLDPAAILEGEAERTHRDLRTSGRVVPKDGTRKVLGRRCREFEVTMWRSLERKGGAPATSLVCVTLDVPVDLNLYGLLLDSLRTLYHRDPDLRRQLLDMPGFQIGQVQQVGGSWVASRRVVAEIVEISRRPPTEGAFTPPAGYRRLERIGTLDL